MANAKATEQAISLHVENIAGITETTVELSPGVSILTGRNATNRTSLLTAIMAALGSDNATVKGGADEGRVELTVGDTTYTRQLVRQNGTITTDGDPYLSDSTLADLFVALLETNDARQAVASGDDLREVIMQPVDTSEIEAEIERHQSQREELDAKIEEISRLRERLPDLEQEKVDLQDRIQTKRDELSEIEDQIDGLNENVDEKREEKRELEEVLEELNDVRSQLETVRYELDTQKSSLDALQEERSDLEAEQSDYDDLPEGRLDGLDAEIERLRTEKENVTQSIDELQTIIQFNENLLDGNLDLFENRGGVDGDGDLTDQLLKGTEEVVCWTCGSRTDTVQIETMLENLRDLHTEHMNERNNLETEIDELKDERLELEEKRRQRTQINDQLDRIHNEIDQRESRIDDLKDQRSNLTAQVERLEAEAQELRSDADQDSELLSLHKEANRLEVEIERLEESLDEIETEITRIEDRVAEQDDLQAQREHLQSNIEDLRTRVNRLEEDAVAQFNDHMEALLDILDYENLERIWIERTEQQVRQDRQTITQDRFELHIVRSTDDGTVYEDTVDHLSESEREVTGLVFALAGYLVHEVHEEVPFMLLDSIEAIDAPRIAELVDYLEQYTDYLVVALLEEDAQALADDYQRITDI